MVFDRFKEKMRQGTGLSKDMHHFKGTDNSRVETMLKEADEYAHRLQKWEKHLTDYTKSTKALLEYTHKTATTDIPQVYDCDGEGKAYPKPVANTSDQSVKVQSLLELASRQEAELQTQVYTPIDNWLALHKEFGQKLKKLDNFRLDLDTARRMHNRSDLERVRHQQKSDQVPDSVLSKIQEQATDLEGKRGAWTQYEATVHGELSEMISQASVMHQYLATALRISSQTLADAIAKGSGPLASGLSGQMAGAHISQPVQSGGLGGQPGSAFSTAQGAYNPGTQNLGDPSYVQMSS